MNRSPNKRPAPSLASTVESVAFDPPETGHIIFQDSNGHERNDAAMLDPGASAILCGYGPFKRYPEHLRSIGFPLERLEFARCYRKEMPNRCAKFLLSLMVVTAPFNATSFLVTLVCGSAVPSWTHHISLDFAEKSVGWLQPPLFEYVVPADDHHGDARLDSEQLDLEGRVFYHNSEETMHG